jgi:O-succinylbenzoic acid--CoA ligase
VEYKQYKNLRYQGNYYSETELETFCHKNLLKDSGKLPSWEKSIYVFILEWLRENDYIEVSSSGSTGKPKIIRLSKEQMVYSAFRTGTYLNLKRNERALLCLPADYIAGKMMIVRSMVLGLNLLAVNPSSKPLAAITEQPDFAALIPLQVSEILRDIQQRNKLSEIRNILIGGGRLDHQIKFNLQAFPNNIYESYGMTETSTHIALRKINGKGKQTYFQVLDGVKISQDDRKCLQVEMSEMPENVINTNDLVEIINPHEFDLLGRIDNVINCGGIKYIPEIIEEKLMDMIPEPFIIASEPDKNLGERLILIIESDKNGSEERVQLLDSMKVKLDKFEMPREIYYISAFPYTETGKINRKKVQTILKRDT